MTTRANGSFNPLSTAFISHSCQFLLSNLFSCADRSEQCRARATYSIRMSEEAVTSSTPVTSSKHARENQEDDEQVSQAKRQRLDEDRESGPCTSSTSEPSRSGVDVTGSGDGVTGRGDGVTGSGDGEEVTGSGEGVASESDEEYHVGGSDGSGDEEGNDADSSDISADDEVEDDNVEEGEGTNIISGQCVELRKIKDDQYRLYHEVTGRDIKILLSQDSVTNAEKLARKLQADNQIAVLDAQGAEVTRDDRDEIIVYATSLAATDSKYCFYDGEIDQEVNDNTSSTILQGNKLVVLRIEGVKEIFATGDLNAQEVED